MTARGLDPLTVQVLWNRLIGIVDEGAVALVRTSFSQVVQECNDYVVSVLDEDGRALADNSSSIPAFIGTLPRTMQHMLLALPRDTWQPGDAVVTNDPWMGTGHLLDFNLVMPVFLGRKLVAFVGAVAHAVDIGGLSWASNAREVFEEGVRIPISRLMQAGVPNALLIDIIRANVRQPDLVIGDLMAMVAACEVCGRRLLELLQDAGLADLRGLAEATQAHAEQAMRAAIRAVPDGTYRHAVDLDGFDAKLRIQAALTVAGDRLTMDYAGTSPQVARGINSVYNYTYAYTAYPLKCALDPVTPKNDGSYRPISILAPEGSILNPRFPAAVSARHLTGMYCAAAAYGALAQAIPDRVMADSSGPPARPVFSGMGADGRPFSLIVFAWGGMGARANLDGLPATAFPGNDNCASVEGMEAAAPVLFRCKRVIPDSGGAGRHQGGAGQEITVDFLAPGPGLLAMMSARFGAATQGLLGGKSGSLTEYLINGASPPPNGREDLHPGDVVTIRYPGGGGYGDPQLRDRMLVQRDVEDGRVTPGWADAQYGPGWRR